jgi:hypothetical protein
MHSMHAPDEVRRMGMSGRRRVIGEWNYDRVFQPVLERILGAPVTRRHDDVVAVGLEHQEEVGADAGRH